MKNNIKFKEIYVKPNIPENLAKLSELSQNLWSTWDSEGYRLFLRTDPFLFRKYHHNPVKLIQRMSRKRLEELSSDEGFLYELDSVYKRFKEYKEFVGHYKDDDKIIDFNNDFQIAYLSMEFGLHESIPIYSGGLGVLAGDHLKAASDMGLPLVAFGLLYRYGYFFQRIDKDGNQEEFYLENDWHSKPVKKLKDQNEKDIQISISLRGEKIYLNAWKIEVGKIPLYLIDSNLEKNKEKYRKITDYLYTADQEMRLLQEIILAFGAIELMKKLNLHPTIYHLNEGHSSFIILKRLEDLIKTGNFNFEEAKDLIKLSTVFTTHTPVPAGNETFEMKLVEYYLSDFGQALGIDFKEFCKLAQVKDNEKYSLSALAIRFSKHINGVSKIHSRISKEMWHQIYPDLCEEEMPIHAITNGVHIQSWLSRKTIQLFDRYLGEEYRHGDNEKTLWENVFSIPDTEIWEAHQERKEQMINFVRNKLKESLILQGSSAIKKSQINNVLNKNALTIGFARRFAPYKRANLILQDKERILKLIKNEEKPVQFIFAGKAHPADENGKSMIKEIINFARDNKVEDRFVFIENYDMNTARHLVQAVDIWLNNPVKPLEASGTSGMKAGMNGSLNLSVRDGWWDECYNPQNGWAIISGEDISDNDIKNWLEANEIYDLLENEIIELYYNRDQNGIPLNWVKKMKQSIYDVGKNYNMHRVVTEYFYKFYLTGIKEYKLASENNFEKIHKLQEVKKEIDNYWNKIKFLDLRTDARDEKMLTTEDEIKITCKIDLDGASDELFQVELFYKIFENEYKLIPLKIIERKDNIAIFEEVFKIHGSGKQSYNVRIKPRTFYFNEFYDYVKWFY